MGHFSNLKLLIVIGVAFISCVASYEKQWLKTNSWGDPSNWEPPRLPCPNDKIVLGSDVVYIQSNVTIEKEIVLPVNGEISFGDNSALIIEEKSTRKRRSSSTNETSKCSKVGGKVSFVGQREKNWLNPLNWEMYTNGRKDDYLTKAAPYIQRVPCAGDSVSFPKGDAFEIDINEKLFIKEMAVSGQRIKEDSALQTYLSTKEGKRRFNVTSSASLQIYTAGCKTFSCKCGNNLREKICETFKCPPTCVKKVKPYKDCCYHCGALIDFQPASGFNIDRCWSDLRSRLHSEIVHPHLGHVRLYMYPTTENEVQILLSEDHEGLDAEVATKFIMKSINDSKWCGGVPKNKNVAPPHEGSRATTIALAIIIPVVIVAAVILAVNYLYKRRTIGIKRQRFENEDNFEYPGVQEIEMTGAADFISGNIAFENPTYQVASETGNEGGIYDAISPEYAIPVDYHKNKRNESETENEGGIHDAISPEYAIPHKNKRNEVTRGIPAVDVVELTPGRVQGEGGFVNPLFSQEKEFGFEGVNPLYEEIMQDFPASTPVGSNASVVELESTGETNSIVKLTLELKDLSDSEEDNIEDVNASVEDVRQDEPRYVTQEEIRHNLQNPFHNISQDY